MTKKTESTRKNAFTLAEVLITLGIIGVVAAMTMPTLINQTNGAQYKAAYKKALSALSQAVTLNVALDDWSFADVDKDNTMQGLLTSRMNVVRDEEGNTNLSDYTNDLATGEGATAINTNNRTLFFNDGIMFTFPEKVAGAAGSDPTAAPGCSKPDNQSVDEFRDANKNACTGYIDVNGLKGPNKVVKCDAKATGDTTTTCTVTSPTDIYPVVFFDQTVLPATEAARAVLYGK